MLSTSTAADGTAKASASVAAMMQPVAGFMYSPPSSFAPVADAQRPGQGVLVDPHEHQGCVVVPGQHHAHLVAIELVFHFPFHAHRSEEHTSELQSLMRISYAVFCLKKKTHPNT